MLVGHAVEVAHLEQRCWQVRRPGWFKLMVYMQMCHGLFGHRGRVALYYSWHPTVQWLR
jgi:hypothetical protein